MARRGSSLGIAARVIVMAVVLVLVARSWREAAPAAVELDRLHAAPDAGAVTAGDDGSDLPGLREMGAATDAHVDQLNEIRDQID